MMRYLILLSYFIFLIACKQVSKNNTQQTNKDSVLSSNVYVKTDLSEMDMSWCPSNYPMQKMQGDTTQKLIARLIYSRPFKKGRSIFGTSNDNLCIYGKPWRLGANEASEITFFEDVKIADKLVKKGTYILYCIPEKDSWTVILNTDLYTWGLHINNLKDIFKTIVPTSKQVPTIENFTMVFSDTKSGADLVMAWDDVKVIMPIAFDK